MGKLNLSVKHNLPPAEALKRIKKLLGETKKEYGNLVTEVKEKWRGNTGDFSFVAKGFTFSGSLSVLPEEVAIEGEIPWAVSFMKGKIEKIITDQAKQLLK